MKRIGAIILLLMVLASAIAVAKSEPEEKGAEEIVMPGGERGEVWFPHRQHQATLGDCQLCHDLFPQTAGSIEKQKAEGTLKQKQVMNKKCLACHRKLKKAGKQTGPVACKKCHSKK